MLFNSLPFAIFFAIFFILYWTIFDRGYRLQNLFLLAGSYTFYAWWDWRLLFLLIGSSALNYFLGLQMEKTSLAKSKRIFLWIGLIQCLGGLVFFKYWNFFTESFIRASAAFSIQWNIHTLHLLLPLGISFYSFKIIAYLLDIKNGKIKPTHDWIVFFSYVAFFPCLISGPIDRPGTFIPQMERDRVFNEAHASDGLRQILWGLFKKIVIADNCALFTSAIFDHFKELPASSLLLGEFFFTIQIYADFSGYSDIAIGLGKLLGIKVTRNFNRPFFAQNIADFWRRWHISLTTWLTDYVFIPLSIALRDYGKGGLIGAILINYTLIGIWHGANWTFILFGFLNGCYYIPLIIRGTWNRKPKQPAKGVIPSLKTMARMVATFLLVMFTFTLFRAETLSQAFDYYRRLLSTSLFSLPPITEKIGSFATVLFIILMFWGEWRQRNKEHVLQIDSVQNLAFRACIYYSLIFAILFFSPAKFTDFIYLKF
jgi:alginate O-acetyltransferase complex protein AlgI